MVTTKHGPKIMYHCDRCNHCYTRRDNLRSHYKEHHPSHVAEVSDVFAETSQERRARLKAPSTKTRPPSGDSQGTPSGKRKEPEAGKNCPPVKRSKHSDTKERVKIPSDRLVQPAQEVESAQESVIPSARQVEEDLPVISLSPASLSLVDQCLTQPNIVQGRISTGGKPKGMLEMIAKDLETSSEEDFVERDIRLVEPSGQTIQAETSQTNSQIDVKKALDGSTLRLVDNSQSYSTGSINEATQSHGGPEPASARVYRLRGDLDREFRQAEPMSPSELQRMMVGKVSQLKEVFRHCRFRNGVKISEDITERTYDVSFVASFVIDRQSSSDIE